MKIRMLVFGYLAVMFLFTGSAALAHNVWLNVDNHYPAVGRTVEISVAWGHQYPANRVDQEMKPGNLAYIQVVDPDGNKVVPETVSETLYKLTVKKPGAYLVTAGIKPGVFTMTTEGRKWCDKTGVENPISCVSYKIEAKTIIVAGGKDRNLGGKTGQELEIIPLSDPSTIKAGDQFSLQVLFRDKPATGVSVNAAYAGYTDADQPADVAPHQTKGKERHFPAGGVTDENGKTALKLDRVGYWIITISHKSPYPDTAVCDQYMHNMAFNFEIK